MSDHDELIAALRAEREARKQAEAERDDAYVRGMAAGQAAMPKGTLTVIDSPEIAALRERAERAEAMVAELRQSKDEAVLAEKMRMMDWCAKRAAISRAAWERASRKAIAGNMAELRNRIAMIDAGPMDIVLSATDASGPSADNAEATVAAAYRDAAQTVECGCARAQKEAVRSAKSGADRWQACRQSNCGAEDAAAILARTPDDAQAALDRIRQEAADEAQKDKEGLQKQISELLKIIDDWDAEQAKQNGGFTMHVRGNTPDWYVLAAFWSCYGFGPDDPRALKGGAQ